MSQSSGRTQDFLLGMERSMSNCSDVSAILSQKTYDSLIPEQIKKLQPLDFSSDIGEAIDDSNATDVMLSTDIVPGSYNFRLGFESDVDVNVDLITKKTPCTFSFYLQRLYLKISHLCLVKILLSTFPVESFIRIVAVFKCVSYRTMPVVQCPYHQNQQPSHRKPYISSDDPQAIYHHNKESGRHSICFGLEKPNQEISFKLNCLNSCPGGINRRNLQLIFTLERGNKIFGRQVIDVKVSACPGRDRAKEESNARSKSKHKGKISNHNNSKSSQDSTPYSITFHVKNKKNYTMLQQLKQTIAEAERNFNQTQLNEVTSSESLQDFVDC